MRPIGDGSVVVIAPAATSNAAHIDASLEPMLIPSDNERRG
jgi:hypothetical protein